MFTAKKRTTGMPKEPFQAAHKGQPCQGAGIPLGKKEMYLGTRDRIWRKHWKTSLEIIIKAAIMPLYIPWYFSRPTTMQGGALFHGNNVTKLKSLHVLPQDFALCPSLRGHLCPPLWGHPSKWHRFRVKEGMEKIQISHKLMTIPWL